MRVKFLTVFSLAIVLMLGACGKKDADLQKAAQDKLAADGISGVTVTVNDGVATLSGQVKDITVKNKADASAKVDGIKSVNSQITLAALPTPIPPPEDQMLKGKVEENLKKAGCTGATVTVANGDVILSGTVPEAKYAECVRVVNESGAVTLRNLLQKGK